MNKVLIVIPLAVSIFLLIFSFNYQSNIMEISSDTMYPTLKPDDIVVVERVNIDEIKEGDIIVFNTHMEEIGIVIHRAIEIFEIDGKIGIDTKGDHLDHPDPFSVFEGDFIGKVTEVNPPAGILVNDSARYSLVVIIVVSAAILAREFIPKKSVEVKKLSCLRCGYSWHPRIIEGKVKFPETCPNKDCRSPYWRSKPKRETKK